MKLRAISINCVKNNYNKQQTFKGVWDKSSICTDFDQALNIPVVKKCYYYHPFSDETEAQIAQVMESNSHAQIIHNPSDRYEIKECKRALRTPFSKDVYEKYRTISSNVSLSEELRKVHYYVSNKFVTSGFDEKEQKTAKNPNIKP